MRSILAEDQAQLKVIEAKLAELDAQPVSEQARKQCLIEALRRSRNELLQSFRRQQRRTKLVAA